MDKSLPSYLGHALMENRNGLIVAAQVSLAASDAERQAAVEMLDRVVSSPKRRKKRHRVTLGADTGYQEQEFVEALRQRKVAPHIAEYENGNLGKNSLSSKERADKRRRISQNKRKWIERVFGWGELDRPLRQLKLRGLQRVDWFYRLAITAYDLTRMSKLIPLAV